MLAWMFFNDHIVEWRYARDTGDKYPLYSQTWRYLSSYGRGFERRFDLLAKARSRRIKEPYSLLSIHVHSLTIPALPGAANIQSVVSDVARCEECVSLQADVGEFLSDVLLAWFAGRWADLPRVIMDCTKERLGSDNMQTLFE